MLPFFAGPIPVTILALVPAAIAWWTGRALLDKGDDPALPELLLARQQRLLKVVAITLGIMLVLGGRDMAWGLPLLTVLLIAGSYPVRRGLLGETWSFGTYLWHTLRSLVGGFGFWIALALTPTLVLALGPAWWWVSLAFVPVLLAWEYWYPKLWLRTHAARPFARADLTPRFDEIVRRAGGPAPAVYRVGPPGSRFVNAIALPSARQSSVALGDALFELLDADEICGIFAHEVAHFDQFTPARVRRIQLINRILIIAAVVLPLHAMFRAPGLAPWLGWLWPLVVVFALGRRAATSQRHETESDIRAAELCGDTEAVVRGLVKLHLHARIPRRWPGDFERAATHPSLVRRIQALRAAHSNAPGGAAVPPTVLFSPQAGTVVVLDATRTYWLEGVPEGTAPDLADLRERASSYRAVSYADLVELRVAAEGNTRMLRAKARGAGGWSVPLAPADVARAQQALDVIDIQLGQERVTGVAAIPPQLLATIVLLGAMVTGRAGVLLIPITVALFRPTGPALAALGAMAIGGALLGALEPGDWGLLDTGVGGASLTAGRAIGLAAMGLAGLVALWIAARRAESDSRRGYALVAWPLGVLALAIVAALAWYNVSEPGGTLVGSKAFGTLALAVLGLAAVLYIMRGPAQRGAAYAGIALAAALGTLGVDRSALFSRPEGLPEDSASATLAADVPLDRPANGLELSPGGTRFLVRRYPTAARRPAQVTVTLGDASGALRDVDGVDAAFLDDERLLVLAPLDTALELRVEPADLEGAGARGPLWADTIPAIEDPALAVERRGGAAAGSWRVFGYDVDETVVLAGTIGERGPPVRLSIPDSISMFGDPIVFGVGESAIVPAGAARLLPGGSSIFAMLLFGLDRLSAELWRVTDDRVARVASLRGYPQCGVPEDGVAVCAARHGAESALWTLSADGVVARAAPIPPTVGAMAVGPGPRAAVLVGNQEALMLDLAERRGRRVRLPVDSAFASEMSTAPGRFALLRHEGGGVTGRARITIYRVE